MDIGSRELPGKIIKWTAIIGGVMIFHEIIVYALLSSLEGLFLFVDYLEILEEWLFN